MRSLFLDSVASRKPVLLLFPRRVGSSSPLNQDFVVYFVASPSTRHPSSCFLTAIESHLPLNLGRDLSLSLSLSFELFSAAFSSCVFSSSCSSLSFVLFPWFPVHRCHPSQSSWTTCLGRSFVATLFLRPRSGFRSVGLWGRKNERTNGRKQPRCFSLLPSTSPSLLFSLCFCRSLTFGRSSLVRSFTRSATLRLPRSSPVLYIY